jgi:DNA-binding SARP family transcriptional activator
MRVNPSAPKTSLVLKLRGAACWRHAEGPVNALERKHAALLAYLWLEGPTPRSRLAGLLWPEVPEERARGNLRQRLLKLRSEAGDLVQDNAGLLQLGNTVMVEDPDDDGAALLSALEFDDCEAYARWLDGRRETDRDARKRQWLVQVREAAQSQRLDDALYAADQLMQVDRESEEAYRVLMEVYYLRGDHAAAISAWDRCRDMLRQLYGVQPSAATQTLGKTLLAGADQAAQQAAEFAADHGQVQSQAETTEQALQQDTRLAGQPSPSAALQIPAAVLRPPHMVGRQAALQALVDGWQAGHVLCVAGVAGVGKSRLLAEWSASLGPGRVATAVAAASARPGDAVLPYASLSRLLFSAIDRFAPLLDTPHCIQAARLLPRLATLAGVTAQPVRSDYERTQALMAFARLLADCTQRGCAALVLDDLQFADPASLSALRMLGEPAEGANADLNHKPMALRFAFGVRPEEAGSEATALLAALTASKQCTRVDLQALSADHAGELMASLGVPTLNRAGGQFDADLCAQIWQQVGGNPAFVLESVKLMLSSAGAQNTATGNSASLKFSLPASIEAIIQRRIELLSPRARHVAQLAAIAGSGYSVGLAAAALACPPIELSEPLRELELRQVFYGRQFVHDVIASVTARSVPDTVAEFMHRFVAEHLAQHDGDVAHIASHWQACGEWRRAGLAFMQAAQGAAAMALANENAALLDSAIAAFEHDPAAHGLLFDAVEARADAFESQGHEGLRPQFLLRLQNLARTEPQRLSALNYDYGLRTNLGQPINEADAQAAIARALTAARPDLAWQLARVLAWQWAMNNRADDALALLKNHEAWVEEEGGLKVQTAYRLARANIFAFGDRLTDAIREGRQAWQASAAAQDWPEALPAMSNLGVMHYWRGEYQAAFEVLSEGRAQRERLYGGGGSGIKIDVHLGAVLYELGQVDASRAMLEGALAEMARWSDNEYRRTECLLVDNHLAQMWLALGRADDAATVLARDATGVAERFYGRRLTLRLRWQRLFGQVDAALVAQLQALASKLASPFNRSLMELELARQLPPSEALVVFSHWHSNEVAVQRPGLQLHAAALAAQAAKEMGDNDQARRFASAARELLSRCAPFDMSAAEAQAVLNLETAVDRLNPLGKPRQHSDLNPRGTSPFG